MTRPEHPRDIWIDVTRFGDAVPKRLLAVDGREVEIQEALEFYLADRITIEEYEARVEKALTGVWE
jgi:hypothetical protein